MMADVWAAHSLQSKCPPFPSNRKKLSFPLTVAFNLGYQGSTFCANNDETGIPPPSPSRSSSAAAATAYARQNDGQGWVGWTMGGLLVPCSPPICQPTHQKSRYVFFAAAAATGLSSTLSKQATEGRHCVAFSCVSPRPPPHSCSTPPTPSRSSSPLPPSCSSDSSAATTSATAAAAVWLSFF